MDFIPPDMPAPNQKGDDTEHITNDGSDMPISVFEAEETKHTEDGTSLLLQPPEKILFCDYMLYWLDSMENQVDEDTYSGYEYVIRRRVFPYFQEKGYTLAQIVQHPHLLQEYYDYEMRDNGGFCKYRSPLSCKHTESASADIQNWDHQFQSG